MIFNFKMCSLFVSSFLILLKELNPLISRNYFSKFLCEKVVLHINPRNKINARLCRKRLVLIITIINCFRFFMLRYIDNQQTRIIWFDLIQISHNNTYMNDIFIGFSVHFYFLYKFLHFNFEWKLTKSLYAVLVLKITRIFPYKCKDNKPVLDWLEKCLFRVNLLVRFFLLWFGKDFICFFFTSIILIFSFFKELMFALIYIVLLHAILFEYSEQKYVENVILDKIVLVLIFNMNVLAFICFVAICTNCYLLISFVYVSLTLIIFLSLNEWYHLINHTATLNNILMKNFIKQHTQGLIIVLNFNKHFRYIFLTAMVLCFLGSVVEGNILLQNSISIQYQLVQIGLVLIQIIIFIGVHFMCAQYTELFHQCKKVLAFHYKSFSNKNWQTQWKLSNYIEKFNTKNRYGFTYGDFRLIDLFSFYKVKTQYFLSI